MKKIIIMLSVILLPLFVDAQTGKRVTTNFSIDQLLVILNDVPVKDLNAYLLKNGFKFESKGSVYSPRVTGPVQNAYTLRYMKNGKLFIVSFYNSVRYHCSYYLSTNKEVSSLKNEALKKGFVQVPVNPSLNI